ncbi:hypothetical protein EKD04_020645 [Chloroflexales bacterium ZM16-3]|nr:hypothetical protein [Chloroflexales bacterium ZM16-3]
MNISLWLASAAGAAALAATLAFAPITSTSAQEIAPASDAALVMNGNGQGRGDMTRDGTCDDANFVDADGDGVCDNAGTGAGDNYVDTDGDGVCDNMGTGTGTGSQSRRSRP